jgi:hypothetical protein
VNQLLASHSSAEAGALLLPLPPSASGDPHSATAAQLNLHSLQPRVMAFMAIDEQPTQHRAAVDRPVDVYKSFQGFSMGLADSAEDAPTATLPIESAKIACERSSSASKPLHSSTYTPPHRAEPGMAQDSVSIDLPVEMEASDGSVAARNSASLGPFDELAPSTVHKDGAYGTTGTVLDSTNALLVRKGGDRARWTEESTGILASHNFKESTVMTRYAFGSGRCLLASEHNATGMRSAASNRAASSRDISAQDGCDATGHGQSVGEGTVNEGDDMGSVLVLHPEGCVTEVQPSGLSRPLKLAIHVDTSSNP